MGANKQISCKICSKAMRSDHLKRHMKKHVDLSSEDPEQICKSILEDVINDIPNKDETSIYKRKDPNSDGMDDSPGDEIEEKELDKILADDNYEYTKKHKLGAKVAKLIHKIDITQIV